MAGLPLTNGAFVLCFPDVSSSKLMNQEWGSSISKEKGSLLFSGLKEEIFLVAPLTWLHARAGQQIDGVDK
jgi:hypothetical protein